jgi:hypothetical protein
MEDNIFHINIRGHKIDYFYDGNEMCIFGQKRLDEADFKLTGKDTKLMRMHSGIDND